MLPIPENFTARFNGVLEQRAINEPSRVYYGRWLRYFLDFCKKYSPPADKSEQVRLFIEKLKSKKQSPQQCAQAAHAVSLFFESQQPSNCPPSVAVAEKPPPPSARLANPPPKAQNTRSAVTEGIGFSIMPTVAVAEPSPSFGPPGGKRYNEWRCLEKSKYIPVVLSRPEVDVVLSHLEYPAAAKHFIWQWFFPQNGLPPIPGTKECRRYHLHESQVQEALKKAARTAKLTKRVKRILFGTVSPRTFYRLITTFVRFKQCWAMPM